MNEKISNDLIRFAHKLADISGDVCQKYFRQNPTVDHKDAGSPIVTIADTEAERLMREEIEKIYPDHGIWGEEFGFKKGKSDLTWTLDPIDGTIAFASGKPIFANLIALMSDDEFLIGIVNQPITKERWVGVKGQKTLFNDKPCQTSSLTEISQARLNTTSAGMFIPGLDRCGERDEKTENILKNFCQSVHVTSYGGDAYAFGLLASGYLHIILENGLSLHDYAALIPVIEGAGGIITDWQGKKLTPKSPRKGCQVLVTCKKKMHDICLKRL